MENDDKNSKKQRTSGNRMDGVGDDEMHKSIERNPGILLALDAVHRSLLNNNLRYEGKMRSNLLRLFCFALVTVIPFDAAEPQQQLECHLNLITHAAHSTRGICAERSYRSYRLACSFFLLSFSLSVLRARCSIDGVCMFVYLRMCCSIWLSDTNM